jgi:hypothetical protein
MEYMPKCITCAVSEVEIIGGFVLEYRQRYPIRRIPLYKTSDSLHITLRETAKQLRSGEFDALP